MATNGMKTSEDAEMAECNGDKVVTMMDVLQEQQDFEDDANAVLGASDDKNCTYSKGYVKRQAIYACLTCCPEASTDPMKRAGVCLACSLACHENHELVELYTKRNFRCDCGNPKFSQPCQFTPNKTDLNYENKYNQNFSGIYCNCKRPYPDPEATDEEEMIQCIICEDWLHTNHLEATVPNNEQYAEMICKECMDDIDFLHDYSELVVNVEDREIVVLDPDLDVTVADKARESAKREQSTNGTEETENKNSVDNIGENKIDKASLDVEMTEIKPDESGDAKDSKEEKNNADQNEQEVKSDTVGISDGGTNEAKENQGTDHEKKEASKLESEMELDDNEKDKVTEGGNNKSEADSDKALEALKNNEDLEADNKAPVTDDKVPETDDKVPETDDKVPETDDKVPETDDKVPETDDKAPETDDKAPEIDNKVSEADNKASGADSDKALEVDNDKAPDTVDDQVSKSSESKDKEVSSNEMESVNDTTDENFITTTVSLEDNKKEMEVKEVDSNAVSISDKESPIKTHDHKRKHSESDTEDSPKKPKLDKEPCIRPKGVKRLYKGATFWPSNFRQKLCTCSECLTMYKDLAVMYLIDPEDTVNAYEALGKESSDGGPSSQYEKGLQALSSLDRVQQINALTEYNKMRDKLLDFLKSFKDRKEIVKEEDIKEFFAGMKPKREPDGVYFCR